MKRKFLLFSLALGLSSSLSANPFFNHHNNSYEKIHNEFIKFFNDDSFFKTPYEDYKLKFINTYPKMDIFENKKDYIFKYSLPGMDKKDIEVTISDKNLLTVKGEKKKLTKQEKEQIIRQEHYFGVFSRSISLPKDVDTKDIQVQYENGILKVTIKKDASKIEDRIRKLTIN